MRKRMMRWIWLRNILQLLDNPELRKTMGEFGRKRVVNELEWEYEVPKLLAAYDQLYIEK